MHNLTTSITISASAEQVRHILTDFSFYSRWNPFITSITGKPEVGHKLSITISADGMKPMSIKPTVLYAELDCEFRWLGHMIIPGLFDGEHYFIIEEKSPGTLLFTHGENFSGIFAVLVVNQYGQAIRKGFEAMNEALKHRAEQMKEHAKQDYAT